MSKAIEFIGALRANSKQQKALKDERKLIYAQAKSHGLDPDVLRLLADTDYGAKELPGHYERLTGKPCR
jgi:hypothetical protein